MRCTALVAAFVIFPGTTVFAQYGTCSSPYKVAPDVLIANVPNQQSRLVWTGSEYGLFFITSFGVDGEVYFHRLDASGRPIGSAVRVSGSPGTLSAGPCVAWTGSEYGVAWQDLEDGNDEIRFTRVGPTGASLGPESIISNDQTDAGNCSLTWTGAEYGLAYEGSRGLDYEIFFARLGPAGERIGPEIQMTNAPSYAFNDQLAWTGTEYALIWDDDRNVNFEIYFTRISAAGVRIGGDVRVTSDASADSGYGQFTWKGTEFGLSHTRFDTQRSVEEVRFLRLDPSGSVVGQFTSITTQGNPKSVLVWTGSEYGLVWQGFFSVPLSYDGFFVRLDPVGNKIGLDVRLTDEPAETGGLSVAWTGTGYGVTWSDYLQNKLFFSQIGCVCSDTTDADGDGSARCIDCNDGSPGVHPGAAEICDGIDQDCDGLIDDLGTRTCGLGACMRVAVNCFQGAPVACVPGAPVPEICDGIDNDCDGIVDDVDADGDGYSRCSLDCDDANPGIHPGAAEICNQSDDDCDGLIDEDTSGVDSDGDLVHNACDNCPTTPNSDQHDIDNDSQGDRCDLDDNLILIDLLDRSTLVWQREVGFDSFNEYRGDLETLQASGIYTQTSANSAFAARNCGLSEPTLQDAFIPPLGRVMFYMATGVRAGVESGLGQDSTGANRPNTNPCP